MRSPNLFLTFGLAFSLSTSFCKPLHADEGLLVTHRSVHPFAALFGLPAAATRIVDTQVQFSIEHSNIFMGGDTNNESLLLDGETTQLHALISQPINQCWQGNAAIAFLSHSGGFLDKAIEDWHSVFNLPNAGREQYGVNQLDYFYQLNGVDQRRLDSDEQGLGELRLSVQRLQDCKLGAPIWRAGIKLGTASKTGFFGSGATDIYVDWQSSRHQWASRLDGVVSAGLLAPGKAGNMPEQRRLVGFGSVGTEFHWSPSLSIVAQLDLHTPLFKSELVELGAVAGQFTLAARKKFSGNGELEVSFSEDVVVDTAPDFSVRLAWRQPLGR